MRSGLLLRSKSFPMLSELEALTAEETAISRNTPPKRPTRVRPREAACSTQDAVRERLDWFIIARRGALGSLPQCS